MVRKLQAAKRWFVGLQHDGVKLRKYYLWHHYLLTAAMVIAAPFLFITLWEGFIGVKSDFWRLFVAIGEHNESTWASYIVLPLCIAAACITARELLFPFRFFCPHCDEAMPSNSPWECPYCHQKHDQAGKRWHDLPDSFLGKCQNPHCKRRPVQVACIHCQQPIALTTQPKLATQHHRQPRLAQVARWNAYKSVYEMNGKPVAPPAQTNGGTPAGRIEVRFLDDGEEGYIDAKDFDPTTMVRI